MLNYQNRHTCLKKAQPKELRAGTENLKLSTDFQPIISEMMHYLVNANYENDDDGKVTVFVIPEHIQGTKSNGNIFTLRCHCFTQTCEVEALSYPILKMITLCAQQG